MGMPLPIYAAVWSTSIHNTMIHPHNPIMQRLGEMARRWQQQVLPRHRLIRWMLDPEDSRMYEGFCRLEASQHGSLDNLFVFFYTPFHSAENFSRALMQDWLQEYDANTAQRESLAAAGIKAPWDPAPFRTALAAAPTQCDALLPEMIRSYREWLGLPSHDFVLALLPKEMDSPAEFKAWLQTWMRQDLPANTQLLLFDHVRGNFWGEVFQQYETSSCTLQHDLRMAQAIREIATAGAATDPQALFRQCLFEMGEASGTKDRQRLQDWGEKAIGLGRKSGDSNLLATAYISYAGMLFNFKAHEKIEELLEKGMETCRKGIATNPESMRPLLLQYYAYKGSHCQLRKQRKEALGWFFRMGEEAARFGYVEQAISAYYKTFIFARYKHFDTEMEKSVLAAMQLSDKLSTEEIIASEYPFLALECMNNREESTRETRLQVEDKMQQAYGSDWRAAVMELEKNYTRQKIRDLEQQAMMEE
jgi:hypothetical protein